MTLAPFQQFMDAINRDIERKHADDLPEFVPDESELGRRFGLMIRNPAKPGWRERQARDIQQAEWAQNPPRSSVELMQRLDEIRRFEQSIKKGE